jgi:putative FmdB family regulatory protein
MPVYTYMCEYCGGIEVFQPITDQPLTKCPECGTIRIRKTFAAVGVHFKGGGFYSTDKGK